MVHHWPSLPSPSGPYEANRISYYLVIFRVWLYIPHRLGGIKLEFLSKVLWLGLAGGAGTIARFLLSDVVQQLGDREFPWGVFVVNIVGSFLFGVIWAISGDRIELSAQARMLILVGFIGGFTTFSSFAFDNAQMLSNSKWFMVAANVVAQNVLGIAAVYAGVMLGRLINSASGGVA